MGGSRRTSMKMRRGGFTLIELLASIAVIILLATLLAPVAVGIRDKARGAQCTTNLKTLFAGASAYVIEKEHWPQIPMTLLKNHDGEYDRRWIKALEPYSVTRKAWICPSIQAS